MSTAESILVIILSSFLALFLLLGIILTAKLIQLVSRMQEIADKAREVADNVESATEILKKSAGPLAVGRLFVNMAETVFKHKRR